MKRYIGPATLLFLGLWVLLLIGGRSRFFQDPGTFWHVRVGNDIVGNDGFFSTDHYTFTHRGLTWIPHQWLGEITMAGIERLSGFDGLLLAACTLLAALYSGLGVRLMNAGFHPSVAIVLIAIALGGSASHFHVRPHLATIAGMALVAVMLNRAEQSKKLLSLIGFLPLCWLWSNIHGGVLGGIASIGFVTLIWIVQWLLKWESPIQRWRDVAWLIAIILGCIGLCFVNPYGQRLPQSWLTIATMNSLPELIKEHAPVEWSSLGGMSILLLGFLYVATLVSALPNTPRATWLLTLVWLILAATRVRHAPLFAVVALATWADVFARTRFAERLLARGSDIFEPGKYDPVGPRGMAIPVLLILASLGLQVRKIEVPIVGYDYAGFDPRVWPVDIHRDIIDWQYDLADQEGGTRLFNDLNFGGYIMRFAPGYRHFIDDRCELYGDDFLREVIGKRELLYLDAADPYPIFADWEKRFGEFDYALVETGNGFDKAIQAMPDKWLLMASCPTANFYRRR